MFDVIQAILNCLWCYAITAVVCILVTGVLVGIERALIDLTGLNLEEAIVASYRFVVGALCVLPARLEEGWGWFYTWGIVNPVWAWNTLDWVETRILGKKDPSNNIRYF